MRKLGSFKRPKPTKTDYRQWMYISRRNRRETYSQALAMYPASRTWGGAGANHYGGVGAMVFFRAPWF
jgi:hypothetical protein